MANDREEVAALPGKADDVPGFGMATGTALDYLWDAPSGGLFEPVEPPHAQTGEAGENGLNTAPPCLVSTLEKYNSWLASFDLYQAVIAREGADNPE